MDELDEIDGKGSARKSGGGGLLKFCLACGCLVIALGLFGVFMAYRAARQMFSMDPPTVEARLQSIVPATVPPGYSGMMAMKIPFTPIEMAIVAPEGFAQNQGGQQPPLMVIVMKIPEGADARQMRQQLQQAAAQQGGGGAGPPGEIQVEAEEQTTVKIRGEDVAVVTQIGRQNGVPTKQVIVSLPPAPGSNEAVIIMGMGEESKFDQAAWDAFLNSVR